MSTVVTSKAPLWQSGSRLGRDRSDFRLLSLCCLSQPGWAGPVIRLWRPDFTWPVLARFKSWPIICDDQTSWGGKCLQRRPYPLPRTKLVTQMLTHDMLAVANLMLELTMIEVVVTAGAIRHTAASSEDMPFSSPSQQRQITEWRNSYCCKYGNTIVIHTGPYEYLERIFIRHPNPGPDPNPNHNPNPGRNPNPHPILKYSGV